MAANAIIYFRSHEHQKTGEDALHLASKEARRLRYDSQREQYCQNTGGSSECQKEAETGQPHLFGHENRASKSL